MTQRRFIFLLVPALALAACGRAEPGDISQESPRPSRADAPAAVPGSAPAAAGTEAGAAVKAGESAAAAPGAQPRQGQPQTPGAAGAASQSAAPSAADAANADEILRRVEQAYSGMRSMEADFVQHLSVPLLGSSQRSEGKLYQRRPDRFLMRFTDPAGDVIVADGRHFWMYQPSADRTQVLRSAMGQGGMQVDLQQEFLSNPTQRYVATLVGTETVDDRPADVLTLVPRGRSQYRLIRIWVDRNDSLVRRFEMTEENETVRRLEFRNMRRNVDLPDSLFQFTPPAGTRVFDQ